MPCFRGEQSFGDRSGKRRLKLYKKAHQEHGDRHLWPEIGLDDGGAPCRRVGDVEIIGLHHRDPRIHSTLAHQPRQQVIALRLRGLHRQHGRQYLVVRGRRHELVDGKL